VINRDQIFQYLINTHITFKIRQHCP